MKVAQRLVGRTNPISLLRLKPIDLTRTGVSFIMQFSSPRPGPDVLRQWLTIVAIVGTFAVNIWSNLFPLNGLNIGAISNTFFADVQIIPANYAFAIWGVIYLGLFAFGIYQLLPAQRQNPEFRRVDYLLVVACVAQAIWVFLFLSRLFALSVVAMLGILLPLIGVYLGLDTRQRRLPLRGTAKQSRQEQWFVQIPISIYLGWITVATVVNIASALDAANWNGWGISAPIWTIVLMIVSAAIAAVIFLQRRDIAYTLVIIWSLIAIGVRQIATPAIAVTAGVLVIGLAGLILVKRRSSESVASERRR